MKILTQNDRCYDEPWDVMVKTRMIVLGLTLSNSSWHLDRGILSNQLLCLISFGESNRIH